MSPFEKPNGTIDLGAYRKHKEQKNAPRYSEEDLQLFEVLKNRHPSNREAYLKARETFNSSPRLVTLRGEDLINEMHTDGLLTNDEAEGYLDALPEIRDECIANHPDDPRAAVEEIKQTVRDIKERHTPKDPAKTEVGRRALKLVVSNDAPET